MMLTRSRRLICTILILVGVSLAAPTAQAQYAVVEVGNNVAQNTISAQSNVQTALGTQSLNLKENVLDGIAYGITRTIIQQMVRSIVNWINSGFQGSPAFLTDLDQFLTDVADQVVSDTLMGSDLAFLCSPFQLDVKVALATNYNQNRADDYQPQCTLDDVAGNVEGFLQGSFQNGGWASWFELTQGESNDPNRAYFEASANLDAKIRNAQGEEIQLLEFGDGFLSFKVCSDTQVQSGAETNCTITTPGTVIADQLNSSLGAGRDQLITADEVNEVIGALLAQLAQQALTGINGLLGLGGNSGYTNYGYGADGSSSYLDALAAEQPVDSTVSSSTRASALTDAVTFTEEYLDTQYEIVARVDTLRADYDALVAEFDAIAADPDDGRTCTAPTWPNTLSREYADAEENITRLETTRAVLQELRRRFLDTADPQVQNDIMQEYLDLQADGLLISTIDVTEAELFIEYDLRDDINDFNQRISAARASCNNSDGGGR